MKADFERLLRLRFDERNRQTIERLTAVKQQLNARGLLSSSETIRQMHGVAETELKESAPVIVETVIDLLIKSNALRHEKDLRALCSDAFSKRKAEVEALYLAQAHHIQQGLANKAIIQPYVSLDQCYTLLREEITLFFSSAFDKHSRDRGGNLAHVLRNRFLNHPVIAWAAVVVATIIVVAGFLGAIRTLQTVFAGNG